jgi:hypothetical protein
MRMVRPMTGRAKIGSYVRTSVSDFPDLSAVTTNGGSLGCAVA